MAEEQGTDLLDLYLRAAEAAGEGRFDEAEAGLLRVVAEAPALPTARFQLGQLRWVRGDLEGAIAMLAPLCSGDSALAAYARAIAASAGADIDGAIAALEAGLGLPQDNTALEGDMRRLLERLRDARSAAAGAALPRSLDAYGRER